MAESNEKKDWIDKLKESQVAVLFLTDLGFLCSPVVI